MKINVDGNIVDLKVGADPEVFASKRGKLFSAHGLVPGTKENPHKVSKGAIQVDGMALEFNIDPSDTCEEFVDNIKSVMSQLQLSLPAGINIEVLPTADFGSKYISEQPLIARELGCSSDLNAYTGADNPKPNAEVPFRTAAGHVHIGWTEHQDTKDPEYIKLCCDFTKVLDLYLGVPSVLMDPDTKRRSLYGAAGAFRAKSYGLEYRVLSNFWLKSDSRMQWVYNQTVEAIKSFIGGFRVEGNTSKSVVDAINNSKLSDSKRLMSAHGLEVFND